MIEITKQLRTMSFEDREYWERTGLPVVSKLYLCTISNQKEKVMKNIEFECPNCSKLHSQKWKSEGMLMCECKTKIIWKDKEKKLYFINNISTTS